MLFLDFLASHDGIALMSAKEILSPSHFQNLLELTQSHNGFISYRRSNCRPEPYELNISYFDAINDPHVPADPMAVRRFMASQAIMLALKGIPEIYMYSLLGSQNNPEAIESPEDRRLINREKLLWGSLTADLSEKGSLRHQVLSGFTTLLSARKRLRSFHPYSKREVIDSDRRVLVIQREFEGERVSALVNVSDDNVALSGYTGQKDAITGNIFEGTLGPYGIQFLT